MNLITLRDVKREKVQTVTARTVVVKTFDSFILVLTNAPSQVIEDAFSFRDAWASGCLRRSHNFPNVCLNVCFNSDYDAIKYYVKKKGCSFDMVQSFEFYQSDCAV